MRKNKLRNGINSLLVGKINKTQAIQLNMSLGSSLLLEVHRVLQIALITSFSNLISLFLIIKLYKITIFEVSPDFKYKVIRLI